MDFKIGSKYKLIVSISSRELVYDAEIVSVDDNFITFKDRFGRVLTYNKNIILSIEEVDGGENE